MNKYKKKNYDIETVGVPLFSELDKKDYDSFVSILLFSIKDYAKDKESKKTKEDAKPP